VVGVAATVVLGDELVVMGEGEEVGELAVVGVGVDVDGIAVVDVSVDVDGVGLVGVGVGTAVVGVGVRTGPGARHRFPMTTTAPITRNTAATRASAIRDGRRPVTGSWCHRDRG
jgi:hypothetical protein